MCVCVVDRNLGPRCTETGNPSRIYIDIDALEIDGSQDDTAELRHFVFLLHFPSSSMYSLIETCIIPALFGSAKWGPTRSKWPKKMGFTGVISYNHYKELVTGAPHFVWGR